MMKEHTEDAVIEKIENVAEKDRISGIEPEGKVAKQIPRYVEIERSIIKR